MAITIKKAKKSIGGPLRSINFKITNFPQKPRKGGAPAKLKRIPLIARASPWDSMDFTSKMRPFPLVDKYIAKAPILIKYSEKNKLKLLQDQEDAISQLTFKMLEYPMSRFSEEDIVAKIEAVADSENKAVIAYWGVTTMRPRRGKIFCRVDNVKMFTQLKS